MMGRSLPVPCRFLKFLPANRRHSQSGGTCNGLRSLSCFCRACTTDFPVRGVPYQYIRTLSNAAEVLASTSLLLLLLSPFT